MAERLASSPPLKKTKVNGSAGEAGPSKGAPVASIFTSTAAAMKRKAEGLPKKEQRSVSPAKAGEEEDEGEDELSDGEEEEQQGQAAKKL